MNMIILEENEDEKKRPYNIGNLISWNHRESHFHPKEDTLYGIIIETNNHCVSVFELNKRQIWSVNKSKNVRIIGLI